MLLGNISLFCYLIRQLFTFCSVEGLAKKVDHSGVLKFDRKTRPISDIEERLPLSLKY